MPRHRGHGATQLIGRPARAAASQARIISVRYGVSVSHREFEMGHEISPEALRALVEWMEQKVVSPIQLL
jgi:predicted esterase